MFLVVLCGIYVSASVVNNGSEKIILEPHWISEKEHLGFVKDRKFIALLRD